MFERYVASTKPDWRRRAWASASLVLHALFGVAVLAWTARKVEKSLEPTVALTFFAQPAAPPPPPPPPPPAPKRRSEPRHEIAMEIPKPSMTPTLVQPEPTPSKKPEPKPANESDNANDDEKENANGQPGGEKGGTAGGTVGGKLGGQLGGTLGGTGAGPPQGKTIASFVFQSQWVERPNPTLPEWFKQQHPQQKIRGMYKVCVGSDGRVSHDAVMTSIAGVDDAVIEQLKKWVSKPQPLPVCVPHPFEFVIN